MAATMIVELTDTTTSNVSKKLVELRESHGVVTTGRVLTLVVCTTDDAAAREAAHAASQASREHPCRVIVLARGESDTAERLDAQIRLGDESGASEILVLHLHGAMADHEASVATPFLLPDTPVVAWWPSIPPPIPAQHPVGRLAIRRITDATNEPDPLAAINSRLATYTPGDTDLAWSRITYWRALLVAELDEAPHEPVDSVTVSGLATEPALDVLAGWLAIRLGCPVTRRTGELRIDLHRATSSISISRPQKGRTATISRTGQLDMRIALARRKTEDCLSEDLRRFDPDEIYESALRGLERVVYE